MNSNRLITAVVSLGLAAGTGFASFWLYTEGHGFLNWLGGSYVGAVAVGAVLYGGWSLFGSLFPDGKEPQGSKSGWTKAFPWTPTYPEKRPVD